MPAGDQVSAQLLEAWRSRDPLIPLPSARMLLMGVRGQVGVCVLHQWLATGADVVAMTRGAPFAFSHPRLAWVEGDLTSPAQMEVLPIILPPIVVFTAPIWLLPPLLPVLAKRGVTRVIAFGSTSIHTKVDSGQAHERALAARFRETEAALFVAGEALGIAVTVLRPTLIYGVGLDRNITRIARLIRRLPVVPMAMKTRGLRQPVHADDLAAATLRIAMNPQTYGKAYDVGGGEQLGYGDMVARVRAQLGRRTPILPMPGLPWMLDSVGRLLRMRDRVHGEIVRRMEKDMVFDHSAAARDFQWQPRRFLDTVAQPPHTPFF